MFARSKDLLNQTTNKPKNYSYTDIEKQYTQIKNILDSCNNEPNELQIKMINTALDNMVFMIESPRLKSNVKTRQFYKLMKWTTKKIKPIKNIDCQELQKYTL